MSFHMDDTDIFHLRDLLQDAAPPVDSIRNICYHYFQRSLRILCLPAIWVL